MILDILFPNRCLHCNAIIGSGDLICEVCEGKIPFTNWRFSEDSILKQKYLLHFPTKNAFALMQFEARGISKQIIHELKYRSREIVGENLARWTVERLDFEGQKPDLITCIPLHRKKQKERGYNQLHRFCEHIAEHYGIPFIPDILRRDVYKKAQAMKNKSARSHTSNLFSLNKKIKNQHILLVDDVFTTGNTMSVASWELLKGEVNEISILVMAMD